MNSPEPTLEQQQRVFADYHKFLHTSTLVGCVLIPVLIALPPRKLDLYTFSLTGALFASANHQTKERTGLGILGHVSKPFLQRDRPRGSPVPGSDGMTAAREQTRLLDDAPTPLPAERRTGTTLEEQAREAWTRGEKEGWRQQRLREEQEKLDQGEGYGSMIVDQIWEVWNHGEQKMEEVKEKDEEVVREEREVKG